MLQRLREKFTLKDREYADESKTGRRIRNFLDESRERFNDGPINAPEAILNFYFNVSFLEIIKSIESLKDLHGFNYATVKIGNKSVKVMSLVLSMERMRNEIEKEIQDYYDRCKIYLLYAVSSELKHESIFFVGGPYGMFSDTMESLNESLSFAKYRKLISSENSSKCVAFLLKAAKRFSSHIRFEQGTNYGGKNWSDIAKLGAQMWTKEKPDVGLLDRVNQIQHNTGTVFNKNYSMFKKINYVSLALDIKFESKNLREMLDKVEKSNKDESDTFELDKLNIGDRMKLFLDLVTGLTGWVNDKSMGYSHNSDLINKLNFIRSFLGQ